MNDKIVLGTGIFNINGKDVALCKGGGKFEINRTYRQIEADGDRGPVKGRIIKEGSTATLTLDMLTVIPENYASYYPGLSITTDATKTTVTGGAFTALPDTDFVTVTWTGKTKDGKAVVITLENAVDLDKINWAMKFKDDVVQEVTYTATYTDDARDTEPWNITFAI